MQIHTTLTSAFLEIISDLKQQDTKVFVQYEIIPSQLIFEIQCNFLIPGKILQCNSI